MGGNGAHAIGTGTGATSPAGAAPDVPPDGLVHSLLADEPMLADLVQAFAAALPERVATMAAAAEDGRFSDVRALAHKLKGAAGSYGYPGLAALALRAEQAARASDAVLLREALDALAPCCAAAASAVDVPA